MVRSQPPITYYYLLVFQEWNEELSYLAQFYAARCEYDAEKEELDTQSTEFDYVGENKLATASYTVNYTILMQTWFNQKAYYDYYTGACTDADGDEDEDGEACQGYTQVEVLKHSIIKIKLLKSFDH